MNGTAHFTATDLLISVSLLGGFTVVCWHWRRITDALCVARKTKHEHDRRAR